MAKIKVARYKTTPFVVNYFNESGIKTTYNFNGAKNKPEVKEMGDDIVNWLSSATTTFTDGELVIVDDTEEAKEIKENIPELEEIAPQLKTKEEIIEILNMPQKKMEKELNKIEIKSQKDFVCDIAIEIKLDSLSKQKFIADWAGKDRELMFDFDEE